MLVHAAHQCRLMRERTGERCRIAAHPVPGVITRIYRSRGNVVVDPGWRCDGALSCIVPGSATVIEAERHAVEGPALQAYQRGRHRQTHPLSERRQSAHVAPAVAAVAAPADAVGTPIGAVFPAAVVPLQHDFTWRICRIQIHIRGQRIACSHGQGRRRVVEIMLVHATRQRRLIRQRAGERCRIAAHPGPGVVRPGWH